MFRLGKRIALVAALVAVPTTASSANPLPGVWRKLPAQPLAIAQSQTGVWTGRNLMLFGRAAVTALDARGNPYTVRSFDVAETYDPASNSWTRLSPPPGPESAHGYTIVWTGKQLLAFSAFHSVRYTPATGSWRVLRRSIPGGIAVWTGREAIGWGGGCCGDAQSNGAAYNPATDTYRTLPRSPLAPSQRPLGAWTGRELLLFVSGYSPDGKPYPARFARAAAYNPNTNAWRRIAPVPAAGSSVRGAAVWDGRELLVVAAGKNARSTHAYDPGKNRWRRLAPLPAPRVGALQPVWNGRLLFVFGGQNAGATRYLRDGLAYDPRGNRWSSIPAAPIRAAANPSAVWTGKSLILSSDRESAAFTPSPR